MSGKKKILRWSLGAIAALTVALVVVRCSNAHAYNRTLPSLRERVGEALKYCRARGLSTEYCILVDFGIPSGRRRMFVWDFKRDTVKYASLCAHGYGRGSTASKPVFSNVPGSYCSSPGHYKTGIRSYSQYGIHIHYKLHGLDGSNSNAFDRSIVLHSFDPVPEVEIFPAYLPLGYSQGCPVISNDVMRSVDALLRNSQKPLLLWIYE